MFWIFGKNKNKKEEEPIYKKKVYTTRFLNFSDYYSEAEKHKTWLRKSMDRSIHEVPMTLDGKKKIIEKTALSGNVHYVTPPPYQVYADMYSNIPSVSAGVNLLSDIIWKLGWRIKHKDGQIDKDLTRYLFEEYPLQELIMKSAIHYCVYGQTFWVEFSGASKDDLIIHLIPSSEVRTIYAIPGTYNIHSFSWENPELSKPKNIENDGNTEFLFSKIQDIDSLIFGRPLLRSLFNTLDLRLKNDQTYRSYLQNAANSGVIALIPEDSEVLKDELESYFRSIREQDLRYRGAVLKDAVTPDGLPRVTFTQVESRFHDKLSLEEKKEIDGEVYDNLGIPRQFLQQGDSGIEIGSGKYEVVMELFSATLQPKAERIKKDLNKFVLPKILAHLRKNKYEFTYMEEGELKKAEASDFFIDYEKMSLQTQSEKSKIFLDGLKSGAITVADYKRYGLGFSEEDILEDDKAYLQPQKVVIIKEGNRKEKVEVKTEEGEVSVTEQQVDDIDDQTESLKETIEDDNKEIIKEEKEIKKSIKRKVLVGDIPIQSLRFGKYSKKIRKFLKAQDHKTSQVEKALDTEMQRDLDKTTNQILKQAYSSVKATELITKLKQDEIKPDEIESEIGKFIDENYKEIKTESEDEFFKMLLLFSMMGQRDGERQSVTADNGTLGRDDLKTIESRVKEYVESRLKELDGTKVDKKEYENDLINPILLTSLNDTTRQDIFKRLRRLVEKVSDSTNGVVEIVDEKVDDQISIYETLTEEEIKIRSTLIAETESSRAFSVGLYLAGSYLRATEKEWLKTLSSKPRPEHLGQVSVTVPIDDIFPSGDYWSNQRPNCKCGIKLIFK